MLLGETGVDSEPGYHWRWKTAGSPSMLFSTASSRKGVAYVAPSSAEENFLVWGRLTTRKPGAGPCTMPMSKRSEGETKGSIWGLEGERCFRDSQQLSGEQRRGWGQGLALEQRMHDGGRAQQTPLAVHSVSPEQGHAPSGADPSAHRAAVIVSLENFGKLRKDEEGKGLLLLCAGMHCPCWQTVPRGQ